MNEEIAKAIKTHGRTMQMWLEVTQLSVGEGSVEDYGLDAMNYMYSKADDLIGLLNPEPKDHPPPNGLQRLIDAIQGRTLTMEDTAYILTLMNGLVQLVIKSRIGADGLMRSARFAVTNEELAGCVIKTFGDK